jgi:photosystem II protein
MDDATHSCVRPLAWWVVSRNNATGWDPSLSLIQLLSSQYKQVGNHTSKLNNSNMMKLLVILASIAPLASAFAPAASLTSSRGATTSSSELYAEASIQFVRGLSEKVIPAIKLTRSKDGDTGVATFAFNNPNVFDASTASEGEVTGMYMVDDEGELSTSDVNANFANGKPQSIESTYVMKSPEEWDRFMRFMEAYGEANGLAFNKAN